jgi:hypothetical protein
MWLAVITNYTDELGDDKRLILGLYSTADQAEEVLLEYYRKEAIRIKPVVELARKNNPGYNFWDAENMVTESGGNGVVDVGHYNAANREFSVHAKAIFLNPGDLVEMEI